MGEPGVCGGRCGQHQAKVSVGGGWGREAPRAAKADPCMNFVHRAFKITIEPLLMNERKLFITEENLLINVKEIIKLENYYFIASNKIFFFRQELPMKVKTSKIKRKLDTVQYQNIVI